MNAPQHIFVPVQGFGHGWWHLVAVEELCFIGGRLWAVHREVELDIRGRAKGRGACWSATDVESGRCLPARLSQAECWKAAEAYMAKPRTARWWGARKAGVTKELGRMPTEFM